MNRTLVPVRATQGPDARWTLVVEREFPHPPQALWAALTDPDRIAEWGPYRPDRNLATTGPAGLTMNDGNHHGEHRTQDATVEVVEENSLLQHHWGEDVLRWELTPTETGTRVVLQHTTTNTGMLSGFAAGWHQCTDALEALLADRPRREIEGDVGQDEDWKELEVAYREVLAL